MIAIILIGRKALALARKQTGYTAIGLKFSVTRPIATTILDTIAMCPISCVQSVCLQVRFTHSGRSINAHSLVIS